MEACKEFSKGVGRPVHYVRGPIELKVKIPEGYRIQLEALEKLYDLDNDDPKRQPPLLRRPRARGQLPQDSLGALGGAEIPERICPGDIPSRGAGQRL